jgi:hypothetical protein
MLNNLFNYLARRRRRFFVLFSLAAFSLMTFLLWAKVSRPSLLSRQEESQGARPARYSYQKADPPLLQQSPIHRGHIASNEVTDPSFIPPQIIRLREEILKENTDEFLVPVLKDFEYSEVDLVAKRDPHFEDYDDVLIFN